MINILKIDGNIISQINSLNLILKYFSSLKGDKILVHGGGKSANFFYKKMNIPYHIINGRRITDKKTLDIITMTYAGLINKKIVAKLQSLGCNSIGFSGVDINIIQSKIKYLREKINYDYVGNLNINSINIPLLIWFLKKKIIPVFCSITHDKKSQLLNTNSDTIAYFIAISLARCDKKVILHYCFEQKGIIFNQKNNNYFFPILRTKDLKKIKKKKILNTGMITKIKNALFALKKGVYKVTIGKPKNLNNFYKKTILCF
jgi:acetylglutamate kinase